jgi:cob(I)alamin adenosyltransferase
LNLTLRHRLASLGMDAEQGTERTIGELAKAARVTVRTIRHYEAVGLLPPTERSAGGHRRYGETALQRLRRILILRELGFGLETIAQLLAAESRGALLATTKRQLERTEVELEVGQRLRERLGRIVSLLERADEASMDQLIDELEVGDMTVNLTRIYTRLGDAGETHLADTSRVKKTHPVIEAGGAIDELGAQIGIVLATSDLPDRHSAWLKRIENDLMDIGSDLSMPFDSEQVASRPRVSADYVAWLEQACDEANDSLDALDSFVLWFGVPAAAKLDVSRVICRRAERQVLHVEAVNPQIVRYLNRLSDLLFILSRAAAGGEETLWEPGRGAERAAG